jgi:hypothetical protein
MGQKTGRIGVQAIVLSTGYTIWLRERLLWKDCRRAWRERFSDPATCLKAELAAMTARVETPTGFVFESGTTGFDRVLAEAPVEMLWDWIELARRRFPHIHMIYLAV